MGWGGRGTAVGFQFWFRISSAFPCTIRPQPRHSATSQGVCEPLVHSPPAPAMWRADGRRDLPEVSLGPRTQGGPARPLVEVEVLPSLTKQISVSKSLCSLGHLVCLTRAMRLGDKPSYAGLSVPLLG